MNKKAGLYIGAIALAAIALIATISFNSISSVVAQESKSQAKAILDLKWETQNAQFIAGKAIADALADASYTLISCGYDKSEAETLVYKYLGEEGIGTTFQGCTFSNIGISDSNPLDMTVSLKLSCEKDSGGNLKGAYKKIILFNKMVQTQPVGNQCTVTITDLDSSPAEVEVSQTAPYAP